MPPIAGCAQAPTARRMWMRGEPFHLKRSEPQMRERVPASCPAHQHPACQSSPRRRVVRSRGCGEPRCLQQRLTDVSKRGARWNVTERSLAIGLGENLAARSDAEYYTNERLRERWRPRYPGGTPCPRPSHAPLSAICRKPVNGCLKTGTPPERCRSPWQVAGGPLNERPAGAKS